MGRIRAPRIPRPPMWLWILGALAGACVLTWTLGGLTTVPPAVYDRHDVVNNGMLRISMLEDARLVSGEPFTSTEAGAQRWILMPVRVTNLDTRSNIDVLNGVTAQLPGGHQLKDSSTWLARDGSARPTIHPELDETVWVGWKLPDRARVPKILRIRFQQFAWVQRDALLGQSGWRHRGGSHTARVAVHTAAIPTPTEAGTGNE